MSKDVTGMTVPIAKIRPSDLFTRKIDLAYVDQLVEADAVDEWPEIILEQYEDGTYGLIDGQHRVAAAKMLGVTELPAIIQVYETEIESLIASIQYNLAHGLPLSRDDRNAYIRMLQKEHKLSLRDIAGIMRCSHETVRRALEDKPKEKKEKTTKTQEVECPHCGESFEI